jgi:hypothetical protein
MRPIMEVFAMLESLLGSVNRERVLIFLFARKEGYAREIARFFKTDLNPIQKQLERLELGGIIYSKSAGKTRLCALNPRYAFLSELRALLEKALSFYPADERDALTLTRQRPRRKDKPL